MPRDEISPAQRKAIDWLHSHGAAELGALGQEIGKWAAELVAELADAKQEAARYKGAFEVVRDELKVLAAVAIGRAKDKRVTITKADYQAAVGFELYVGQPQEGVRIYQLRNDRRPTDELKGRRGNVVAINDHISRIIRPS